MHSAARFVLVGGTAPMELAGRSKVALSRACCAMPLLMCGSLATLSRSVVITDHRLRGLLQPSRCDQPKIGVGKNSKATAEAAEVAENWG